MTANAALVRADLGIIQTKLTVGLVTACESIKEPNIDLDTLQLR